MGPWFHTITPVVVLMAEVDVRSLVSETAHRIVVLDPTIMSHDEVASVSVHVILLLCHGMAAPLIFPSAREFALRHLCFLGDIGLNTSARYSVTSAGVE